MEKCCLAQNGNYITYIRKWMEYWKWIKEMKVNQNQNLKKCKRMEAKGNQWKWAETNGNEKKNGNGRK